MKNALILTVIGICAIQMQDRLWADEASENWKAPQQRSQQFSSLDQTGTLGTSAAAFRLQALEENQSLPVFGESWFELGPAPLFAQNPEPGMPDETWSGQVSAIAVDLAHDPSGNLVYVGSSSGGLWKSTNGLSATPRFVPLSDQSQSLSVGAVALNMRSNPPIIYVGTGAPDNSANISSYTGVGILISADGGDTWKRVDNADSGAHTFVGQGFSSILIDPRDPRILLASTGLGIDYQFPHVSVPQGDAAFKDLGIYRSIDAGNTWNQVMSTDYGPVPPHGFYHTDLLYVPPETRRTRSAHQPTRGTYFAGISRKGPFVSMDRGESWTSFDKLGWGQGVGGLQGLPDASQMVRVSLATRDGVLWALLMLLPDPSKPPVFELWQSDDGGRSWSRLSLPGELESKGFLMYVAAPPKSNTLLVAAEHLFRKEHIRQPNSPWVKIEHNLHGDQHAIAFASHEEWYVGDDGGAWATTDRGESWTSLNDDLRTLEFFSADEDKTGSGSYVGGMQDNGPAFTSANPVGAHHVFPAWDTLGGDGMYVAADPLNSTAFFMSQPHGKIFYFSVSDPNGAMRSVIDFNAPGLGAKADFLTPYEILPTDPRLNFGRSRILLIGANNPWLVRFDPDLPSNNKNSQLTTLIDNIINYVAPVPCDPTTAYVTAGSTLYRLNDISFAHDAGIQRIKGGPINGDVLGHLAVSETPCGTLYLAKVGFLAGQKIFKTDNAGATWTNISGNLPNTPINWITVDPRDSRFLYVATDTGVYVATDGGVVNEQWQRLGSGLPNVPVMQTKISPAGRLIAATYGRNVWALDIPCVATDVVKIDMATLAGHSAQGMEFHILAVSATSSAFPEAKLQVTVPGCVRDAAMHPDPEEGRYVLTGTRVFCPLFSKPGVPLKYTAKVTSTCGGSASAPVQIFGQ